MHRYSSTIHGDYRRAYLIGGGLLGAVMGGVAIVKVLMGSPQTSPVSYLMDGLVTVGVIWGMVHYKVALPEKSITLKEAMLVGMGTAVVAATVYGVVLLGIGLLWPEQTRLFTATLAGDGAAGASAPLRYWAFWWAFYAWVSVSLVGAFVAFVVALFVRNEKAKVK